jgi:ABC-2 type transport system ATP-binding protein
MEFIRMKNVIELEHVTKHYQSFQALDDISFTLQEGEVFGLLGPNGAGKTTTIRMLNGLLPRTSGQVRVFGLDPETRGDQIRLHTGVLTETPALYERLTARQNLEFSGRMYDLSEDGLSKRVDEVLAQFELTDRADDRVGTYSKGMKQRMALARALLHQPDLLFLDEPTAGLDPESAGQVNALIEQIGREHKKTVFLCTHLLYEAQKLCDRVAVLNHGRVLALGTPQELARDLFPGVHLQVGVEKSFPPDLFTWISGLNWVNKAEVMDEKTIRIDLAVEDSIPDLVASLVGQGVRICKVVPQEVTLEEVYFSLQEKAERGDK